MYQVRHIPKRFCILYIYFFFLVTFTNRFVCHILFMGLRTWHTLYMGHQLHVQKMSQITDKVEYLYMTISFTSSPPPPCNKVKTL